MALHARERKKQSMSAGLGAAMGRLSCFLKVADDGNKHSSLSDIRGFEDEPSTPKLSYSVFT